MSVYRSKCKYQLIYPVVGTRAYLSLSPEKGAKKCYEELKSLNNVDAQYFTVLNIDTYETYKFKIDSDKSQKTNNDNIQQTINNLNIRVQKLESKVFEPKPTNQIHPIQQAHQDAKQINPTDQLQQEQEQKQVSVNNVDYHDQIRQSDNLLANVLSKDIKSFNLENKARVKGSVIQKSSDVQADDNCSIM
jgi:hypothetical protein